MQDRVKLGNGRSNKIKCPTDYNPSSFAQFLSDWKAGIVYVDITPTDLTESVPGVSVVGTTLEKDNLLSDTTAAGFGFASSEDPTIDDVFKRIGADYIAGTLPIGITSLILTDSRIKTTSHIDIYCNKWTSFPVNVVVTEGQIQMTFDPQTEQIEVNVRVW